MHAVDTNRPHVRLDDDGIVCIDYSHVQRMTLASIQNALAQHRALSMEKRPVLILGKRLIDVERDAMRFASHADVQAVTLASAIVTTGYLERYLGSLFLMYHRPPYPARLFGDQRNARQWLLSHTGQHATVI